MFRSELVRKKKKVAARRPFRLQRSDMVCAIADFPVPAEPESQSIFSGESLSTQFRILSRILSLVDGWHLGCGKRSFESCMAPGATKLCKRSNAIGGH